MFWSFWSERKRNDMHNAWKMKLKRGMRWWRSQARLHAHIEAEALCLPRGSKLNTATKCQKHRDTLPETTLILYVYIRISITERSKGKDLACWVCQHLYIFVGTKHGQAFVVCCGRNRVTQVKFSNTLVVLQIPTSFTYMNCMSYFKFN